VNKAFFKELFKGLKWFLLALAILAICIAAWYGFAWSLGWYVHHFFDLKNFGQWNYVQFGSCILVFTLVIQIVTVVLTGWFLIAWGKSRGFSQKEMENGNS